MNNTNTSSSSCRAAVVGTTFKFLAGAVQLGLVLVAMVALFASSAAAQLAGTGAISGTITDPTGAVVSGATVTATDVATNVKTVRTTTGAGDYNITPLAPGTYTVSVTAPGFQQLVQENIVVDALATVGLPLKLTVGRTDETVTVSAAPPLLSTTDATLGGTMDNEMYSSLPLMMGAGGNADQRRATDFAYLMPGVQGNFTSNNSTSNSGIVNGSGPAGGVQEIYIEGINLPEADQVGDPRFTWTAIGVDAVDQFQVQTAGIGAQYGGQGLQNYSIKSGGNAYHGSIYEYIRNTIFDAWSFASKVPVVTGVVPAGATCAYNSAPSSYCTPGGVKPREIMNEFGIVLSGPVIKNRLFLFGNYGQYRYQAGAHPTPMTIPTSAMLGYDANGNSLGYADFTGFAGQVKGQSIDIYDPTTQTANCSSCSRTVFKGIKNGVPTNDVIPGSRISAPANAYNKFMLPYEALASQTTYTNNLVYGTPLGLANWYSTGRIDYTVNQRNQIGVIVAFGRQSSTGLNMSSGLAPPFNATQTFHPVTTIDIVKDTFTISPHLVNQFAVGYGRYQSDSVTPNRQPQYAATGAGILNMPSGQASDGFPGITYTGTYTSPATQGGYSWNNKINNTYTLTDTLQWVFGKHNLNLGGQIVDAQFNYYTNVSYSGPLNVIFNAAQTEAFTSGQSMNAQTGSSVASYLLGAATVSTTKPTISAGLPGLGTRWLDPSFWAQDDYKVSSKLTLNLGLRWDIYPSVREAHNIFTFLNPTGKNNITGNNGTLEFTGNGDPSIFCNCTRPSSIWYKNIAPRLGMAYSVDSKTVVRGSYNVNFARGNWTSGSQSGSPSQVGLVPSGIVAPQQSGAPAFYWDATSCPTGSLAGVPCGFTTSVLAPPAPPAGGASLAEFGTGNTGALGLASNGMSYFDPYRGSRTPEFLNWTFGIQRQITNNMTINVSYVGSQGHFLNVSGINPQRNNKLTSNYAALAGYNVTTGGVATPCSGSTCGNVANTTDLLTSKTTPAILGAGPGLGFPVPNQYTSGASFNNNSFYQYYVPFPQFLSVSDTTSFAGNTNFHALEITLSQRASHGLSFTVNYTYSKAMDDVGTFRLPENPRLDRSLSTTDQPQNFVAYSTYALPFGHGHIGGNNFWVNALAGGWNLAGIFTYHSGTPLVATGTGCAGNSILNQCMPNMVPGVKARQGSFGKNVTAASGSPNYYANIQYLNPAAFTVNNAGTLAQYGTQVGQITYVGNGPADYVPGNAARIGADNVWSMGTYDLDMTVRRTFAIYHEWKLAFEASAFNVPNHVVFGAVNGGVGGTTYGQVGAPSTGNLPRDFQFSGRLSF
jgi:hypothetical protein